MPERSIVSVSNSVSQIDEPVFETLAGLNPEIEATLVYWNDYGFRRSQIDPELGLTPVFPQLDTAASAVTRIWLDSRTVRLGEVIRSIRQRSPDLVILNDLPRREKFLLAARLRLAGLNVGFRSDKNELSEFQGHGLKRLAERLAYRSAFNVFCPVSLLAVDYYAWPRSRPFLLFPYPTDISKFSPANASPARALVRKRLGIPRSAIVLLAVAKFVQREGPIDVLQAFFELHGRVPDVHLILVGSGPEEAAMRSLVAEQRAQANVHFTGYVPFAELQDYFFASEIFVHLARQEPWGVSVSDALCAGLGVITSDHVGAGVELLTGGLERYVTPVGQIGPAADALEHVVTRPDIPAVFAGARARVEQDYSSVAIARRLANFGH